MSLEPGAFHPIFPGIQSGWSGSTYPDSLASWYGFSPHSVVLTLIHHSVHHFKLSMHLQSFAPLVVVALSLAVNGAPAIYGRSDGLTNPNDLDARGGFDVDSSNVFRRKLLGDVAKEADKKVAEHEAKKGSKPPRKKHRNGRKGSKKKGSQGPNSGHHEPPKSAAKKPEEKAAAAKALAAKKKKHQVHISSFSSGHQAAKKPEEKPKKEPTPEEKAVAAQAAKPEEKEQTPDEKAAARHQVHISSFSLTFAHFY